MSLAERVAGECSPAEPCPDVLWPLPPFCFAGGPARSAIAGPVDDTTVSGRWPPGRYANGQCAVFFLNRRLC